MALTDKHLTEREVEHYRRRSVALAERRGLDAHLGACEDCLKLVLGTTDSMFAFDSLNEAFLPATGEEPFHLSEDEIGRFQRGLADEADRVIYESHLEDCQQCQAIASALPAFKPQSSSASARARGERPYRFRTWPWLWTPARAAAFVSLVAVAALLLLFWVKQRQPRPTEQVAQTETANANVAPTTTPPVSGGNENAPTSNTPDEQAADNQSITLSLKDGGGEIGLDTEGRLVGAGDLAPATERAVAEALSTRSLQKPQALNGLSGPAITLMDQSSEGLPFKLIGPIGTITESPRPRLRWQALNGATSYTVSVFDENFNRIARSEELKTTEWTVSVPLRRGQTYSWEVTALHDNREITSPVAPAPRAQFRVLESEKVKEIARARGRQPTSHLILGVLYTRAGLLPEAEREFQILLNNNPGSSVARRLLQTVRAWQRR